MIFKRIQYPLWLAAAALLFPQIVTAQTQWTEYGISIASTTTLQVHLSRVPDGNGGVFTAYEKDPSGDTDIYAQWIDQRGNLRWGPSGILVCPSGLDQKHPAITGDGSGGVYIAWQDESDDINLYAQHLDASGSALGTPGGFPVCKATGDQTQVKIVSDGSGGAILVWQDKRNDSTNDLYAQRIDGSGNPLWTTNGVPVTTASGSQSSHIVMADGFGNVYVVWQDYRNGYSNIDIYSQKLLANGTQAWDVNGKAVVSLTGNQYSPAMDTSDNKLIISWQDSRFDNGNIYAQALDSNGSILWTADGVAICQATATQNNSHVIHDNSGGAYIAWVDNRSYYDIYAQHIDENGNISWSVDGIPVNESTGLQYAPELVSDGSGGALVVWNDKRSDNNINLYAQHINGTGSLLLDEGGLPVVDADSTQQNHVVVSDGSGGAITLWQDGRDGQSDIYAQLVNDNISLVTPTESVLWVGDQSNTIEWTLNTTSTKFDHLTLRASSSPGDGFPVTIAQDISLAQFSQNWTPGSVNSSTVTIKIQAEDAQDSIICEYFSSVFSIDSNPPGTFSLISPADGQKTLPTVTFRWETALDDVAGLDHYELWIGDTLYLDNLHVTELTLEEAHKLPQGYHTWTVKAVDSVGFIRTASETWQLQAYTDLDPPDPFSLLLPANNEWVNETSPQFTWSASADGGSGLAKYQFYLDGELEVDNIPPSTRLVDSVTLTNGSHDWYVVAVDSLDNTRSSVTWTLYVDNTEPQPFDITDPEDDMWTSDTTPSFTWEATADTGIGLAEYQLWIDDGLVRDNISGQSSTVTLDPGEALEEGIHTWYILANDSLDNGQSSQSTFSLGVDTTSPDAFSLTLPFNDSFTNNQLPTLSWNASEDGGSGLSRYQLWIDGELIRDSLDTTTSSPVTDLSEGVHTWYVTALDSAGNTRTTTANTFTVDITPPESFNLTAPRHDSVLHTNRPEFTWESTTDILSGLSKFQFFIDSQVAADSIPPQQPSLILPDPFENGTYTWKVWAWDRAGNYYNSGSIQFTIDCNPPEITSPASAEATEDALFTYTATATDVDGDDVTFTFHDTPTWLTPSENQISGTPVNGAQDTSFLVVAFDGIYSDSLEVTVDVLSVNDYPSLSNIPNQMTEEDRTLANVAITVGDEETPAGDLLLSGSSSDTVLIPDANIIFGGTGENRDVTMTPAENAYGECTITIRVSDGDRYTEENFTLTVTPVNDPPVISAVPDQAIDEDSTLTAVSFQINDIETDAADLILTGTVSDTTLTVPDIQFGGQDENRSLTVTPKPDQSGAATVTIFVNDGDDSTATCFTLTVNPVNDAPVITSPGTVTATEDQHFVYQATATDVDGPSISIQFRNYPGWLTPSGPEISGTPTNGIQSTVFQLIATDGTLTDTLNVSLTVIPVNDPPHFDFSFPEPVFSDTDTLNWHLDLDDYVSDPDNPDSTLTWSHDFIDHASITVSIDSVNHRASFFSVQPFGICRILFTVNDPLGAWAADTLKISFLQTGIEDQQGDIPRVFDLSNNYPNPFNPFTTIEYSIPKSCRVTLCIYNMLGQKVETLIDEKQQPGTYEVRWNASNVPSGIYLYRMQAEAYQSIKRMVLIK